MLGWEASWNRDVLERIVALLFALAELADLAAGVPFLRRRHVLGILRGADVEARAFVVGMAPEAPALADAPGEAADAACLAVRFRVLALLLSVLLTQAARPAFSRPAGPRAGREGFAGRAGRPAAAPAADTS